MTARRRVRGSSRRVSGIVALVKTAVTVPQSSSRRRRSDVDERDLDLDLAVAPHEEEQFAVAHLVDPLEVVREMHGRSQGPDLARLAVGALRLERPQRLHEAASRVRWRERARACSPRRGPVNSFAVVLELRGRRQAVRRRHEVERSARRTVAPSRGRATPAKRAQP